MSEQLKINPDDLTIGDLEDFEEVTGLSLDEALKTYRVFETDDNGEYVLRDGLKIPVMEDDPEKPGRKRPATAMKVSTKTLKALIWISRRKENPDFTVQDARNVKVTELVIDAGGEAADPKDENES